jgi:hypothetical protein
MFHFNLPASITRTRINVNSHRWSRKPCRYHCSLPKWWPCCVILFNIQRNWNIRNAIRMRRLECKNLLRVNYMLLEEILQFIDVIPVTLIEIRVICSSRSLCRAVLCKCKHAVFLYLIFNKSKNHPRLELCFEWTVLPNSLQFY